MDPRYSVLLATAATLGLVHTAIGIDHTLPFVALGRARGWPLRRTLALCGLCGVGHVLSSVLLGAAGIALGVAVSRLAWIEAVRGDLAAWLLIGFGLAYAVWGWRRTRRGHVHAPQGASPAAWGLFIVFVLGPCEPLIPLLVVPALEWGAGAAATVALVFAATTLATMLGLVAAGHLLLALPRFRTLETRRHTLAGLAIAGSGLAIRLLGI